MIKKLTKSDEAKVLEYLYQEPSINIFIIGDIELFGFEVDYQDIYAEYKNDEIISVLLRYKDSIVYYSHIKYFNVAYLEIIKSFTYQFISAKESLMEVLRPHFSDMKYKPMYFCEASSFDPSLLVNKENIVDVSKDEEIRKVFRLLVQIEEFDGMKSQSEDEYVKSHLETLKHSKTYSIEEDNICASTVSTVADTKKSAMVVAVATDTNYRKKGYASRLMIVLMDEYLNKQKKSLCLFYDNPEAGKIYHRLGFKDIDKWVMLVRK